MIYYFVTKFKKICENEPVENENINKNHRGRDPADDQLIVHNEAITHGAGHFNQINLAVMGGQAQAIIPPQIPHNEIVQTYQSDRYRTEVSNRFPTFECFKYMCIFIINYFLFVNLAIRKFIAKS